MSQPVQACKPGLRDLSMPTTPAYFFVFLKVYQFSKVDQLGVFGFCLVCGCQTNSKYFSNFNVWHCHGSFKLNINICHCH